LRLKYPPFRGSLALLEAIILLSFITFIQNSLIYVTINFNCPVG